MIPSDRRDRLRQLLMPLAHPLVGLVVGIGPHQELAAWLGVRPGWGVFLVVNVLLPAIAAGLAVVMPRPVFAAFGGLALSAGLVVGSMLRREPLVWHWSLGLLKAVTHPILIPATMGYAIIGAVVAALVRSISDRPQEGAH